jgi:hypothetical protein
MNDIVTRLLRLRIGRRPASWSSARLDVLERWYAAQPVARVAGAVLELDAPLDHAALRGALTRLRERHAHALNVTLSVRAKEYGFVPCEREPLPLETEASDPWTVAEQELGAAFPAGAPLWRVRVTGEGKTLVAVFHHVVADGVSTSVFARELLASLRGEALPGLPAPRLPLEACLDVRPSVGVLAREAARDFRGASPSYFRGPRAELGPRRTRLYPFELPEALVQTLAVRARAEGTTVHAALCGAGLVAAAAASDGFPLNARVTSPISLRARMSPAPAGMGVFICAHDSDQRADVDTPFWRQAEVYGRELARALPEAYERVGLLRFAGDLSAYATRLSTDNPNARTGTLEVSNLGRVNGLNGARVWFIQGNHYHGPLFNLTVGTSAETGVLRATLAVAEPVVAERAARAFVRDTRRALEIAAAQSGTMGELLSEIRAASS